MRRQKHGRLSLWVHVGSDGKPPDGSYTIGGDISQGTGASNSVLSIVNNRTKEKVGEFVSAHIRPDEFAKYAVALSKWFHNAFLIWEANGPGRIFGDVVIKSHYAFIFWRDKDERKIGKEKSDIPGWFSTGENKTSFLGAYRKALAEGEFINRSKQALRECLEYIFLPNGTVAHSASTRDEDPSGARESHGDRAIADALALKGCERGALDKTPERVAKVGSLIYRRQHRARRLAQKSTFW